MQTKPFEKISLSFHSLVQENKFFTAAYYKKPKNFFYTAGQYAKLYSPRMQKFGHYYISTHPDEEHIGFLFQNENEFSQGMLSESISNSIQMEDVSGGVDCEMCLGKTLYLVAQDFGIAGIRPLILEILKNRNKFGVVRFLCEVQDAECFPFARELNDWMGAVEFYDIVREKTAGKKWFGEIGGVMDILKKLDPLEEGVAILASPREQTHALEKFFLQKNFTAQNIILNSLYER